MKVLVECLGVIYEDASSLLIDQNKSKDNYYVNASDGGGILECESTIENIFELLRFCLIYSNKLLDATEIKNIWEKILLTR
jgi:hypothetical protein